MKYLKILLITLLFIMTSTISVKALSCDNATSSDLTRKANYVKASYEVEDKSVKKDLTAGNYKTTYKIPYFNFKISIYNIVDGIYAVVTNDVDNTILEVHPNNTQDGTYTFDNSNFTDVYNYTIEIRSDLDACKNETIRTIKVSKPKYNAFSEYKYCNSSNNYYCKKFITKDLDVETNDDFFRKIGIKTDYDDEESTEDTNSIKSIIKKNTKSYIMVSIITVLVTLAILLIPRLIKKNREMES